MVYEFEVRPCTPAALSKTALQAQREDRPWEIFQVINLKTGDLGLILRREANDTLPDAAMDAEEPLARTGGVRAKVRRGTSGGYV